MLSKRGGRGALLAGAAAVFAAAAGGAAWGNIPGTNGVINGCHEKRTGILRVIDVEAGKACTQYELPISWNQRGPRGEPGPQGERGSAGAQGPQGPQGPAGPGVDSVDDLSGLACTVGGGAGTTAITIGADGAIAVRCETAGGGGDGGGGGIEPGDLGFNPMMSVFGLVKIGTWSDQTVTVTNRRNSTIDEIAALSQSSAFEITNACGSLPPGGSCTIRIRFRPAVEGVHQGTVTIGNHSHPVSGQGVS